MTTNQSSHSDYTPRNRLIYWLANHARAFFHGLGELTRAPFASIITVIVIGLAMALPASFYLLLHNFQSLIKPWNNSPSISLYLKQDAPDSAIKDFETMLKNRADINQVKYISPEQGLRELKENMNDDGSFTLLDANPLPPVLVITPASSSQTPTKMQTLFSLLKENPLVDTATVDVKWVERLHDILTLGTRITDTMAMLFAVGVILIISNTIRLTTQAHRQEMTILKLVGATNAFIRRPLLYRGFLYGLLGGLIAWLLVVFMLWSIKHPAQHLAQSYGYHFSIHGLNLGVGVEIIISTALLGLIGAWVAVRRHLTAPEIL